ncbi:hypothetical protein AALP_AA1G164500 [Arabis alpina]|uniref:Uncharacterized protein n=1 Tax=Arabis alpina TaxID=50452 RepID=A0A087HNM1_ARAAL|nr:hypothetical protein AALP_AA1G164500 [Arabis alpina]
MASVDVVAIPSQANYGTFDDLRLGRSSQQIVSRLLRFWDAHNIKKDGQFLGIVLLLLDEKSSTIHGFIPAARANDYRDVLHEWLIFQVGSFEVARCTNLYKITDHPFVFRFLLDTKIHALTDVGPSIEKEKFMLRKHDHLQALSNTNLELPGANLDDPTSTQRLIISFQMDMQTTVNLSLWDEAAATFRAHLSSTDPINSVMLVTTINPKMFGGNMFLNSTPATRFFFDPSTHAIKEFTKSLGIEVETPFARADTSNGIRKQEMVSIQYLYKYISQTNKQSHDADFLCKGRIVGVLQNNGWSYISCAGCSRKLDKYGATLRCSKCIAPTITGVVRYRVELAVHDGHDVATFVVFDKEMTKITKKTAAELTLEANGATDSEIPSCLEELAGKTFIFQLKVTSFNFTPKHRTFTVSTMTPLEPEDGIIPVGNPPNEVHNGALPVHNGPPTAQLGAPNFEVGDGSNTGHSDVGPVVNPRKRAHE